MSRPKTDPVERVLDGYEALTADQQDRVCDVIRLMYRRKLDKQTPPAPRRIRKPKDAPSEIIP